jgi:hypothetical protein
MSDYNVQAEIKDIVVTQGDTIDMSFRIYLNNGSNPLYPLDDPFYYYDATGMQIDCHVRKDDGTLIAHYSSAGGSPEITIVTSTMSILAVGFTKFARYHYDFQLTNAGKISTFRKGNWIVHKQITV